MTEAEKPTKETQKLDGGSLPIDWKPVRLRTLLMQDATYGIVKAEGFVDNGIPMLRGGDIKNGRIGRDMPNVSKAKSEEYQRTILRNGDVVIALVGYPGEAAVVPPDLEGANISRAVGLLRPSKALSAEFLCCYLNSESGRTEFLKPSAGSAQIVVNLKDLNNLTIPIPQDKREQSIVAETLNDADALIEELEKLIAKKRLIKQGAMQELLTGKRRLPGFSGEWSNVSVAKLGDIVTGGTPPTTISKFWNGPFPWITPTDISEDKNVSDSPRTLTSEGRKLARALPSDTLLVTCIASIGKNAVLRQPGACNQQINAVIPNQMSDVDFLYYLLELNTGYLLQNSGITATRIISKKVFSDLEFYMPELEEQRAIAAVLSAMDEELSTLEAKLSKARQMKQGMMQELLTGRIRLV